MQGFAFQPRSLICRVVQEVKIYISKFIEDS